MSPGKETRASKQAIAKSLRKKGTTNLKRQDPPEENWDNRLYQQLRHYVEHNHPKLRLILDDDEIFPPYVTWVPHNYPETEREIPLGLKVALVGTTHHEDAVAFLTTVGSADNLERHTDKVDLRMKTVHNAEKIDINDKRLDYLKPFNLIFDDHGIQRKYFVALVKFFFIRYGAYPDSNGTKREPVHDQNEGNAFLKNFCKALEHISRQMDRERKKPGGKSPPDAQEKSGSRKVTPRPLATGRSKTYTPTDAASLHSATDDTQAGSEEGHRGRESATLGASLLPRTPQYTDRNQSPLYQQVEEYLRDHNVALEQLVDMNDYIWKGYKSESHLNQGFRIANLNLDDPEDVFAHITTRTGEVQYRGCRHGEEREIVPADLVQMLVSSAGEFIGDFKFLPSRNLSRAHIDAEKMTIGPRLSAFVKWHFLRNRYAIELRENEKSILEKAMSIIISKKAAWAEDLPKHLGGTQEKSNRAPGDMREVTNDGGGAAKNGESSSQATTNSNSSESNDDSTSESSDLGSLASPKKQPHKGPFWYHAQGSGSQRVAMGSDNSNAAAPHSSNGPRLRELDDTSNLNNDTEHSVPENAADPFPEPQPSTSAAAQYGLGLRHNERSSDMNASITSTTFKRRAGDAELEDEMDDAEKMDNQHKKRQYQKSLYLETSVESINRKITVKKQAMDKFEKSKSEEVKKEREKVQATKRAAKLKIISEEEKLEKRVAEFEKQIAESKRQLEAKREARARIEEQQRLDEESFKKDGPLGKYKPEHDTMRKGWQDLKEEKKKHLKEYDRITNDLAERRAAFRRNQSEDE